MDELECWKCGVAVRDVPLPLSRRAECPACHAELHVCRMCRHYDTAKAKHCREPMAEEVKVKTRANFCEWFQPAAGVGKKHPDTAPKVTARSELERLFGKSEQRTGQPDSTRDALEQLFGGKGSTAGDS